MVLERSLEFRKWSSNSVRCRTLNAQGNCGSPGVHPIQTMLTPQTIGLSFSNDPEHLRERESAIRKGGFGVASVSSEIVARFEIEMGRCDVLLICYTIPPSVSSELASLF